MYKKKYAKRMIAFMTALILFAGSVPAQQVRAASEELQPLVEEQIQPEMDLQQEEQIQPEMDLQQGEQIQPEMELQQEDERQQEELLLNYLVVESPYIEADEIQNIIASIGDGSSLVTEAVLEYRNRETGAMEAVTASQIVQDGVRFQISGIKSGSYEIVAITYETERGTNKVVLADVGIAAVFGVNETVDESADAYIITEDVAETVDQEIVRFDEEGNQISEQSLQEVLEDAGASVNARSYQWKNLIVVLDPGHDKTHAGAQYYGYGEESLVLKIAKYCKAELEEYGGVTVYLTRDDEGCPFGGAADCNAKRVEYAKTVGADVYVSFHLNANDDKSAGGAGVYYPNSNYNAEIGQQGKELAQKIVDQLSSLGLSKWAGGVLYRNSEDNTRYPDGSLADYLAIIRRSKLEGIPAVLIEHAFLSNKDDVEKFLNSEEKLKRLGTADAVAIADYYGLIRGVGLHRAEDGNLYYYQDGIIDTAYNGLEEYGRKLWYVRQGKVDVTYNGICQYDGAWYYIKDGSSDFDHTGLVFQDGRWYYISEGIYDYTYTGMFFHQNNWHYLKNGVADFSYTGMCRYGTDWYYVKNGILDWSYTGMCQYDGNWYYVKNGVYDRGYTGMCQYDENWYYVKNGVYDTSYTGMCQYGVNWYYVQKGVLNWKATGMCQYGEKWYYVRNGVLDWKAIGMCQYGPNWYYVKNGVYDTSYTGMCQYDGNWYYVQNGVHDRGYTGMCQYGTDWYYVQNGVLNWKATGMCQYGTDWWYVKNGKLDFGFSGVCQHGSNLYYVTYGKLNRNYLGYVTFDESTYKVYNGVAEDIRGLDLVTLNCTTLDWNKDQKGTFSVFVNGKKVSNNTMVWISSDPSVATIDGNGVLTGIKAGKAEIICTVAGGTIATCQVEVQGVEIMGPTTTTVAQMVSFFNSKNSYPSFYKNSDAPTIEDFCRIYIEECLAEGVRAEVAFCQSMKETGFLRFKEADPVWCVVSIDQYNFAGLDTKGEQPDGTIDVGRSYHSVREGIRAHVQRLKAYAAKGTKPETFRYDCIDPDKWSSSWWVTTIVGSSPYVEWLGKSQNPSGYGWATDPTYGYSIIHDYMDKLSQYSK